MRECWISVYPRLPGYNGSKYYHGIESDSRSQANENACGKPFPCGSVLRRAGVGYRLHVRLKVPALPATDALAAGKAGEDERRSHHGA